MKRLIFACAVLLAARPAASAEPPLPVVYGFHHITDPDGIRRWHWYPVTPADAPSGWVRDPATGERVWWRWVPTPRPHVVYYRDRR